MPRKPPQIERSLILANDHRREYGSRITFEILRPQYFGELENVSLLLEDGTIATVRPGRMLQTEAGKRYEIELKGFPTASEAEDAGLHLAQALLLLAVSLNFGLRLSYKSHEPPAVFDRTASSGFSSWGEAYGSYSQDSVISELMKTLRIPLKNRRLMLSMELFVASALESNDRAKFVMAVSALEPLAEQADLGPEVAEVVDRLRTALDAATELPPDIRDSLRGRLLQLKQESVRQALKRLCRTWVPSDESAWKCLDLAYSLRSELLHEGRPSDLDVLLAEETRKVSAILRRIYQHAYGHALLAAVAA